MGDQDRKTADTYYDDLGHYHTKSQGLTLEKVVVELGDKDFSAGLSSAAISQVKTLKGLAFCTCLIHA